MLTIRILLFYCIYLCFPVISKCSTWQRRQRITTCRSPDTIDHAILSRRHNLLRITCERGYFLQGPRLIECVHGKWVYDEKPVCAHQCSQNIKLPLVKNGGVRIEIGFRASVFCNSGYIVAGNRVSYCTGYNGDSWDRPLGSCILQANNKNRCDFETDDLCGWSVESVENHQWKRKSAVNILGQFNTGPQHDHTVKQKSDGHFMIMESLREYGVYVPLISPIYQRDMSLMTACCFRFYYFMYGLGIGDLYVFVKPFSVPWEDLMDYPGYMKFNISGHQESSWKEVTFHIPEMKEDFQIVFLAKSTKSHLSDIAIDDVSLLLGADCPRSSITTSTKAYETTDDSDDNTTNEPAIADSQSCASRCFDSSKSGLVIQNGKLYLYCNCHLGCDSTYTCCLDYRSECLPQLFTDMGENNSTAIVSTDSTTTTTKISTTTTRKPFSTTTTTRKTTTPGTTAKTKMSTASIVNRPTSPLPIAKNVDRNITSTILTSSTQRTTSIVIPTKIPTTTPTPTTTSATSTKSTTLIYNSSYTGTTISLHRDESTKNSKGIKIKYTNNENIIEHPNQRGALLITFIAITIIILISVILRCQTNIKTLLKINHKDNGEEIKDTAKFIKNHTPSIEIYHGTTVDVEDDGKKRKSKNKFFKAKKDGMSEPLWDDESPTSDL